MFLKDNDKRKCCGCGACVQICPKGCICMTEDENGFLVPKVDRKNCVNCGLCEKVCPMVESPVIKDKLDAIQLSGITATDKEYRYKSASGGAFGKLAEMAYANEGERVRVWGAAYVDGLQVAHVCASNSEELEPLRKSKYVQSDLRDAFSIICRQLNDGMYVIFSGTPCQVAALRNYVQRAGKVNQENLVCVDLVCHGVPAQKAFDDYLAYEENKVQGNIVSFSFRHKMLDEKGQMNSRAVWFCTDDGKEFQETKEKNPYLKFYHTAMGYRDSCYECPYAKPDRIGDLTIKDFWSVKKFYPEYDAHEGVSIVIANTIKGQTILNKLVSEEDVIELKVDVQEFMAGATGGTLSKPTSMPERRQKFLHSWRKKSFVWAVEKYCKPSVKIQIKRFLKKMIKR